MDGLGGFYTPDQGSGGGAGNGIATLATVGGAGLVAFPSAAFTAGALAYVVSVGAYFQLVAGALATDGITIVNALGKAGYQWLRVDVASLHWSKRTNWVVDPANSTALASDENDGATAATPLLTFGELQRRLGDSIVGQSVSVRLMSASTENVDWRFEMLPTFTFEIIGDLTPIYTGVATTVAIGAAAPSTDNGDTIIDATVPVSFTASGMLANGILFKRTNGTAIFWWAARDLGGVAPLAKLRISRPVSVAGTANANLANGDTYTANSLFSVGLHRFSTVNAPNQVFLTQVFDKSITAVSEENAHTLRHSACGLTLQFFAAAVFMNPCILGTIVIRPTQGNGSNIGYGGLVRAATNTGPLIIAGGGMTQWALRIVCQGGQLHANGWAALQVVSELFSYDCLGSFLVADYQSFVLFQNTGAACIGGNNNATNAAVFANKGSVIETLSAAFSAAGVFTSGTPYSVGGAAFSEAQVDTIGGPSNQMATKGNGIFRTD